MDVSCVKMSGMAKVLEDMFWRGLLCVFRGPGEGGCIFDGVMCNSHFFILRASKLISSQSNNCTCMDAL